jgi:hypothetical protein
MRPTETTQPTLRTHREGIRPWHVALSLIVLIASIAAVAPRADAAKPLETGFADYLYGGSDRDTWLSRTAQANAGLIRVNLEWRAITSGKPDNPRDPADPAYDFSTTDNAIEGAADHGLDVLLTVYGAPDFAEGPNRPPISKARAGVWKPNAGDFGDFAHAVATRYSGSYSGLPEVRYMEPWNEPNLDTYIAPQWNGKENVASDIYTRLLNSFYEEAKDVNPGVEIVSAGVAPYGDDPGGPHRTRPLRFYRELLCLNDKLKKGPCPEAGKAMADAYAAHPINREDPPTEHAADEDDLEIADFGDLKKTVKKAEKLHTTGTGGKHELIADEVWWQTDPPDRDEGVSLKTHTRWMAQGLYLLWKQGAAKVLFLQFRDAKYTPGEFTLNSYQTGVYTFDGKKKPSFDAVRFPFVTDRKSKSKVLAWGKAPASGKLTIEVKAKKKKKGGHGRALKKGGGFKKVATVNATEGKVFTKKIKVKGKAKVRAVIGGDKSPVWSEKG